MVPTYEAVCSTCGPFEVTRPISQFREPLVCACGAPGAFRPSVPFARIDDQENVGSDRRDGTAGFNLGLPGVTTDLGGGHSEYRPVTGRELGSNHGAREYARRHDLTPADGGRYRTIG